MEHTRIGLLHPGQMGSAVGRALVEAGHRVLWVSADRSAESRERAAEAGLDDAATVEALAEQAEVILSICPPHAASEVAAQVAALGFTGIYTDCNAISPERTRAVETTIAGAGATYVDGGIVGGPPAGGPPRTWLYLSGAAAGQVAACFPHDALHAVVLSDRIGAASALKMCYAANTKGTSALFAAILALAEQEGVRDALERQWGDDLTASAHKRAADSALKAWRFVGEMHEIAATFTESGLPGGFHEAAAEIYERLAPFKGRTEPPDLGDVLDTLQRP
ncbi:MAG: prephenate dehydrogenase/arogenate dehydrogenase family protein [Spirochaetaceae bacterium]|nr:prephenate dehydrogenase/arogenate dehydrogenase family protein [Spirochaetaceae bacterium]